VTLAAAVQPILFVISLHWIDPESEECLNFLSEAVAGARILLVCSHRPGYRHPFGDRSYHQRVTIDPLSEAETAELTRVALGGAEVPEAVRRLVASKAEGNPFFVEEVTKSLLEDGTLRREDGRVSLTRDLGAIEVPDRIHDVLMARIDRLARAQARHQDRLGVRRGFALRLWRTSGGGRQGERWWKTCATWSWSTEGGTSGLATCSGLRSRATSRLRRAGPRQARCITPSGSPSRALCRPSGRALRDARPPLRARRGWPRALDHERSSIKAVLAFASQRPPGIAARRSQSWTASAMPPEGAAARSRSGSASSLCT
jgi:hypothetical protein